MQVGRGAGPADVAHLLAPDHTVAGAQNDAGWIKMAVEGVERRTVWEIVPDDDCAAVAAPAIWLGIGHQTMADAIDRQAEIRTAAAEPPIFPSVKLVIAAPEYAKILTGKGNRFGIRRI